MTTIDVNTAGSSPHTTAEKFATSVNLEAAVEIARQLRLREIGGLVVVDLIDMRILENRRRVMMALRQALSRDTAVTQVLDISSLGLVELVRRHRSSSLARSLLETCPSCDGAGRQQSVRTVSCEIERNVINMAKVNPRGTITIDAASEVIDVLAAPENSIIKALSHEIGRVLEVRANVTSARDQFDVYVVPGKR